MRTTDGDDVDRNEGDGYVDISADAFDAVTAKAWRDDGGGIRLCVGG